MKFPKDLHIQTNIKYYDKTVIVTLM